MFLDLKNFTIPFSSRFPTEIIFGDGCLEKLAEVCLQHGQSALLVSGNSSLKSGRVNNCEEQLKKNSIIVNHYNNVSSNPTVHHVNEIVRIAKDNKSDVIIGLGGGSVIDAAKAAAMIAIQGGNAEDYLLGKSCVQNGSLALIAIPTTAGTGTELSKSSIISWPERGLKGGIRGTAMFPRVALVDPLLTISLPIEQIKITGFDCFAHAVETYISLLSNPITTIFSSNAIKAVTKYLPSAISDQNNLIARRNLSFYSMLMGYNLANSSTCLPHRLQYPLGSLTDTPHALGLAAIYPAWVSITHKSSQSKFVNISKWMSEGLGHGENNNSLEPAVSINEFINKIGMNITIKEMGCSEKDCHNMADSVTGNLMLDPWWQDGNNLANFYLY